MATETKTRASVLAAWLERNDARPMWTQKVPHVGEMNCYLIKGRVLLTLHYKGEGWEVFVPASDKNDVAATLDGAALALGCEGCAGLV